MYGGWILLLLCGPAGSIRRGLSSRALRAVATLGYGVYLTYFPLCEHVVGPLSRSLVKGRAWPTAVVWPLAVASLFAMSLLAAYILHLLIEKPCRKRIAAYYSGAGSTSSA
jgi:peptidoglycan/LPS O-acetylase OafA/YrhL